MSDCLNVEVRELLPELMLGSLPPDQRAWVEAHVASCQECAEELSVLRTARRVLAAAAPRVDVAGIVRALPAPPPVRAATAPRGTNLFRIAAAVSFISLGGLSLAVARTYFDGRGTTSTTDSLASLVTPSPSGDSVQLVLAPDGEGRGTRTDDRLELSVGGGVSDLAIDDLRTLLGELEGLEAAPEAEPDHNPGGRGLLGGAGAIKE